MHYAHQLLSIRYCIQPAQLSTHILSAKDKSSAVPPRTLSRSRIQSNAHNPHKKTIDPESPNQSLGPSRACPVPQSTHHHNKHQNKQKTPQSTHCFPLSQSHHQIAAAGAGCLGAWMPCLRHRLVVLALNAVQELGEGQRVGHRHDCQGGCDWILDGVGWLVARSIVSIQR